MYLTTFNVITNIHRRNKKTCLVFKNVCRLDFDWVIELKCFIKFFDKFSSQYYVILASLRGWLTEGWFWNVRLSLKGETEFYGRHCKGWLNTTYPECLVQSGFILRQRGPDPAGLRQRYVLIVVALDDEEPCGTKYILEPRRAFWHNR